MKRDEPSDVLVLHDTGLSPHESHSLYFREEPTPREGVPAEIPDESTQGIDHERARQLILMQTERLLPPLEANALADHLLECDRCFRFAQDIAHQERQSGKHKAAPGR
jgi:hypothetical protein